MKRHYIQTAVLGSGAAGLAAAVRLDAAGIECAILTEGLTLGTSLNTGSDKQTYYKLGLSGCAADSASDMAASYLAGGSADGRLALVESCGSVGAFFHLVQLGVPFPHDACGGYAGYKTDHDPARRATSCGPYTSRQMCRALYREVCRRKIPVFDRRSALKLFTVNDQNNGKNNIGKMRIAGLIAADMTSGEPEVFTFENLVFAVGGPGGFYEASVYPAVHFGGIGLALEIGAEAVSLPESQFGLSSATNLDGRTMPAVSSADPGELQCALCGEFRWNVSGTFMQVLPRVVSTDSDGKSNPVEFLRDFFSTPGETLSALFLKGYQWPFDVRRVSGGSSLIDLAVLRETNERRRRVFLDFRTNPSGLDFDVLSTEAREYLEKSGALFGLPIDRLRAMNPAAIELYRDHGIDLAAEPLEIRLSAQHNNGGLAGNIWYESTNIARLFPIGEVNGSHGVARPGGSALNAGQVGAFRAAELIAAKYAGATLDRSTADAAADAAFRSLQTGKGGAESGSDWKTERAALQKRMTAAAGALRSAERVEIALDETHRQRKLSVLPTFAGGRWTQDGIESLRNRQMLIAAESYLSAILFQLNSGVGSRGSALVFDRRGEAIHEKLPESWRKIPEDESFRTKMLRTVCSVQSDTDGDRFVHRWTEAAPIPTLDDWFESVWRDYREKRLYD